MPTERRTTPAAGTGLSIGRVTLTVHDLDGMRAFYEGTVGLHLLWSDGENAALGVGDKVMLDLRRDRTARPRSWREAGLFHTAFLLPSRADLAGWVCRAVEAGTPILGAADHAVSEAIYLADPEGNGIEIYADRPPASWCWRDGMIAMPSDPLDIAGLLIEPGADGTGRTGIPQGGTIGHVHLQVGAIPAAEAFYAGVLGLDVTCRYPGGTFYAADGYHHHLATNVWNSRGAPPRAFPSTGLDAIEIRLEREAIEAVRGRMGHGPVAASEARFSLADPWGTPIALTIR